MSQTPASESPTVGMPAIEAFVQAVQKKLQTEILEPPLASPFAQTETAHGVAEVPELIRHYAHCAVSTGISAVNGQPSTENLLTTAVPGITRVLSGQWKLLRAIWSLRHPLEDASRDLLLSIMLLSHGGGDEAASFSVQQGSIHLRKAVRNYAEMFGLLLPSLISDTLLRFWVPPVEMRSLSAVIAVWAQLSTVEVGRLASRLGELPLLSDSVVPAEKPVRSGMAHYAGISVTDCDFEKLKILINLLKDDQADEARVIRWFAPLSDVAVLSDDRQRELRRKLPGQTRLRVDFQVFQRHPLRVIDLVADLVALALEDGRLSRAEVQYIKEVTQYLGLEQTEIEYLLEECRQTSALVAHHTLSRL